MSVFIQLPGRGESSRTTRFIDGSENLLLLSFQCSSLDSFPLNTRSVCSNRVKEKERGQKKRKKDDVWLTMKKKAEGGLEEEENKYICLICMQAFQLLKLSIFPVAIPMRVLDRQATSCMEYQVALHVHISTQRIATYMHTRTHTNTSKSPTSTEHLRAITHFHAHTS